jgi:hypothetical protein
MRTSNVLLMVLITLLSVSAFLTGCGNNNAAVNVEFTTYTDTHSIFSISYPADWEILPYMIDDAEEFLETYSENPDMSIDEAQTIFTAGERDDLGNYAVTMIMLMDCPMFFNSITDSFITLMVSGFKSSFENSKEISRDIVTIDGREAAIIEFEGEVSDGDSSYMVVMLTINREQIWTVTCMVNAEKQDEYDEIFDTVVRSLVILNSNNESSTIPSSTPDTNQSPIENIFSSVEELRGLSPTNPVFISSEELTNRINELYEEEYTEEEEEIDKEIYMLLDLIEDSDDLSDILKDVQSEQVSGYYDDESNDFYIVGNEADLSALEKITIAHEYTHALQDQNFDLSTLPLQDENNCDRALAARSLIEGDASLCEFIYAFDQLTSDDMEDLLNEITGIDSEALDDAPAVINETLLFPYEAGLDFVMEAYEEGGWDAINDAYSDPPQSTEQIIHPEKYLSSSDYDEPQTVEMPDIKSALGTKWKLKYTDVLGELTTRIYLDTFISAKSAENAAAGWDGDKLEYWKNNTGEQLLGMYWIWDSEGDAEEFYDAYLTFMENKIDSSWDVVDKNADYQQWQGEDQSIYLSINELNTLIIISTDEAIIEDVVAKFP